MNKSDLKQLIREEIEKASNERFSLKAFKTESELLDAINALPNDIDEVGVPTKLGNWDMMKKIDPEEDQNWKETVKSMLDDLKVDEEKWNEINQFKLRTWTGNVNRGVYIQLSSDATERFAADMGSGKYGRLD
tara:strand:- start:1972 stop:2370 length:399 start_codon:yes stop_codon:yes gene_type:complete